MPGESKSERTKLRLLQAAAGLFASRSFETVSTRAIAKEAGVDAALIHHYFGSKEGLFQAVLKSIIRPEDIEAEISISSRNSWGRELVHAVDRLWASPAAPAMKALLRRSLAGHSDLIRDFVTTTILNRIIPHLDCSEPERHLRASLAGSQLSGFGGRPPHRRCRAPRQPAQRRGDRTDRPGDPALPDGTTTSSGCPENR